MIDLLHDMNVFAFGFAVGWITGSLIPIVKNLWNKDKKETTDERKD